MLKSNMELTMAVKPVGHVRYQGYTPGAVGRITAAHAVYYHKYWGFDVSFEAQVAAELAAFVIGFQAERDGLWEATVDDVFTGAIAIADTGNYEARLRWFIVMPPYQQSGIGKALIQKAVVFSREKGYRRVYLWTFEGLDRARKLYELSGFTLSQEQAIQQWGQRIKEQRFDLLLS
jgi:GNAT superfamily N-acetyltransferase